VTPLPPPPPWLAPLQEAFGAFLERPLDMQRGTLRSPPEAPALLPALANPSTARARIALYHEQYWMRLFAALQTELPRFAQVVGYWHFNALATLHVRRRPPTRVDIARCGDGLSDHLIEVLDRLAASESLGAEPSPDIRPISQLVRGRDPWEIPLQRVHAPVDLARQALRMDEATRQALGSPHTGVWHPTRAEVATLAERRLRFAPSFRLLREDWALADRSGPTDPPPPFARHSAPRFWVSFRAERTTALAGVEPGFAQLLRLTAERPFGEALDAIVQGRGRAESAGLEAALPRWIQRALSAGWWIGTY
jgi:hypothetical protein